MHFNKNSIMQQGVVRGITVKQTRLVRWLRSVVCAGLITPVGLLAAPTAPWKPSLEAPPNGTVRGPQDPITLVLPELPINVLETLVLELDGIDVTQWVNSDGRRASFVPPQALSFGQHELRLVENAPDGSIIERGVWTLDIRKTQTFREADTQAAVTVVGSYRVDDNHLVNAPDKFQTSGAAQWQGAIADGNWRATGYVDVLHNSALPSTGAVPAVQQPRSTELGQFLFTGTVGDASLYGIAQVGHHQVVPDSLIAQGFLRRGVSAGVNAASGAVSATAFSQHTSDIIGFQQGLGVGREEDRTNGVTVSGRPLPSRPEALVLTATYLAGEGPDQLGAGAGGDPTVTSGRAGSVVADSLSFDRRLRLRGEYAATRFDFDGEGRDVLGDGSLIVNAPAESDYAYAGLASYTPWHDRQVKNHPLVWNVGVEHKRIGTFFRSPAFPMGIPDRKLLRAFSDVSWAGMSFAASLGAETNNVNDLRQLERVRGVHAAANLSYTPPPKLEPLADGSLPRAPWYGQPFYTLGYQQLRQDVVDASVIVPEGRLRDTRDLAASASFSYTRWNWTALYTWGETEDFLGIQPDTRTRMAQLQAAFRIGDRLTLGPAVGASRVSDLTNQRDTDSLTVGLNGNYSITERIAAGLAYNLNRVDARDDLVNRTTRDAIASLIWTAIPPRGLVPGLNLSLEGQYHDGDGTGIANPSLNTYQIFVKAAVNWLPSF